MRTKREILFSKTLMTGLFLAVACLYTPQDLSAQGAIYEPSELSEQPKIADAGQARQAIIRSYSQSLQSAGLEGRVQVAFVVNTDGSVDEGSIKVVSSPDDGLSKAAEVAVRKLKFQPGKKDGQAVRCQVVMPIQYKAGN